MLETLKRPTEEEKEAARLSASTLKEITSSLKPHTSLEFKIEGKSLSIPRRIVKLIEKVLGAMASGKAIEVSYISPELTTQEAADILHVSRPHLIKLLETGKIPHKMAGTHRRVLLHDVRNYDKKLKETRRKNLELLAQEAQEMKLGYE